jgi:hypothetical protein
MKIVIEIGDYDREWIANGYHIPREINRKIAEAIIDGIPLPEHHGRLIDEQQIIDRFKPIERFKHWCVGTDGLFNVLSDAPTIIEGSDSE